MQNQYLIEDFTMLKCKQRKQNQTLNSVIKILIIVIKKEEENKLN
jgi:hypothetical protein